MDHIDLEIDKAIKSFGSDLSANKVWKSSQTDSSKSVDVIDRALVLLKFLSNVIHKGARVAINILKNGK